MKKSVFRIAKMDCPSEERMIRLALGKHEGIQLQFDLENRTLSVAHNIDTKEIDRDLSRLNLGSRFVQDLEVGDDEEIKPPETEDESKVLKILLLINFSMFLVEIGVGFVADSTGLIADSFDMLADSIVYGLSLYAVGKAISLQHRAARMSGWFQVGLAVFAMSQVIRRFIYGSEPISSLMIGVSLVALIANVSCLFLLKKHRGGAAHMRASWIFSTNDVLANIGVIVAGVLVAVLKSPLPDLIIGTLICVLVTRGAISILRISSDEDSKA